LTAWVPCHVGHDQRERRHQHDEDRRHGRKPEPDDGEDRPDRRRYRVEHRQDGLEEGSKRAVGAEQDAARHAERDRQREAREHPPERGEQIDRQIAALRELDDAREHAPGGRQHIRRHRERDQPPRPEEEEREGDALHDDRHARRPAGGVGNGRGAHGASLAFS
jgi:hypothetical protein